MIPFVTKSDTLRANLILNNLGSAEATVSIRLNTGNGQVVGERSWTLNSFEFLQVNGILDFFPLDGALDPFEGYFELLSSEPVSGSLAQITNDGAILFLSAIGQDSDHFLIPIFGGETSATALSILNHEDQPAEVGLIVRNPAGASFSLPTLSLGPRNQHLIPDLGSLTMGAGNDAWLEVVGRPGSRLVVAWKLTHAQNTSSEFSPGIPTSQAAREQYLPFQVTADGFDSRITVANTTAEATELQFDFFAPTGVKILKRYLALEGFSTLELVVADVLSEVIGGPAFGLVRIAAEREIVAASLLRNPSPGGTLLVTGQAEGSRQWLIPSAARVGPFVSSLMVSNLGRTPALARVQAKDRHGVGTGTPVEWLMPPRATVRQSDILNHLLLPEGSYGPVTVESVSGEPLIVLSEVIDRSRATSGFFASTDTTPSVRKRMGELLHLSWQYPDLSRISEFRIYRGTRRTEAFEQVGTVQAPDLEYWLQADSPGRFLFVVTAFSDGIESWPSEEVVVEVSE
ncbi:MAG: hypothetical protein AB1898_08725 [Acidobacteriota bacterium]